MNRANAEADLASRFLGFLTNFGIIDSVKLTHSYYFAIFTTTFAAGATCAFFRR